MILFRRNRDLAVQEADEVLFLQAGYTAVHGFDAGANLICNLLAVFPQDERCGAGGIIAFDQVVLQLLQSGQKFYAAVFI